MDKLMPFCRRLFRFGSIAVLAFALVVSPACKPPPPPPPGKRVGNLCSEIAGPSVDGKMIRLSDYKGKVVLVNFWATWCRPCREQIPHEKEKVQVAYANRPFVMLGVAADSMDVLREFFRDEPLPWPNIADGSPSITAQEWNVEYFPSALLVDHTGVIRHRWFPLANPEEVWLAVERAVRTAEGK
jgi:peroxiredoxin